MTDAPLTSAPGLLLRASEPPPARTLVDVLTETAARHPDASALEDAAGALSYRELLAQVFDAAPEVAVPDDADANGFACCCHETSLERWVEKGRTGIMKRRAHRPAAS